jgi:hypothetical protein
MPNRNRRNEPPSPPWIRNDLRVRYEEILRLRAKLKRLLAKKNRSQSKRRPSRH